MSTWTRAGLIAILSGTVAVGIWIDVGRRSYPIKFSVAAVIFVLSYQLFQPLWRRVWLTPGESRIRRLVREVYGANVTHEQVVRSANDRVLIVRLQNESLEQLHVNLTSLARKQKQGASTAALKRRYASDLARGAKLLARGNADGTRHSSPSTCET